ncbi:HlyD family efflux transporter periplasmic adaptor subunit [Flavobacterium sp. KACC 22761]|uniref:HlyD family efflux transporter periplasmic adaptor subunit n=1 Tax=Flavobacterium sp. KACC 22761 TaxID=3092665 RepID=UPI002A7636EA|nr:HlyD family efflux transporter periplasmic adaptor subunit [Flavobacterium sp. KACC 22761]WPO77297.1 HlyD family efflux transporter periplasmic adaptor subunit [Flavobacterium sp. KACC 22761]
MAKKGFHKTLNENRTEEVASIIERMPTKFGFTISGVALGLVLLLLLFGWLIKYPSILAGQIVINTRQAPVRLIASTSGNIILLVNKSEAKVKRDEYLAYIKNEANLEDVKLLDRMLVKTNIHGLNYKENRHSFPENLVLGEINNKYFNFLNSLYQYLDYSVQQPYEFQKQINQKLLELQVTKFSQLKNDAENQKMKYLIAQSLFKKDSTLFAKDVTSKSDIEHSLIAKANSELDYYAIDKEINNTAYQINEAQNKAEVIAIEKAVKERELVVNLFNSYYELADAVKKWERTYVFVSPIEGKIDFLNFTKTNDYIQSGQELFKIVPDNNQLIGQVNLPENGSGKVKVGQSVIIKLNNYPYNEYGSVKGKVKRISLATNQQMMSDNQNKINSYLIDVTLPFGLKTNYGVELNFHAEAKGTAEIITEDRRLIERFFDNLRYKLK